ncbi:MAG: GNAT family N-acetyltransferase [Enterocloster sp.]
MKLEKKVFLQGSWHTVVISDEYQALQAAKAAGRAIIGVDGQEGSAGSCMVTGIPYMIPSFEYATGELAELVLRRHLGLPWIIDETERLLIRELVREDAKRIPEEEYGSEEEVFRSEELLSLYIRNQYGFYEYGTWALILKAGEPAEECLIGLAGVSNPRLLPGMDELLKEMDELLPAGEGKLPWLELGYHIFRPWRRQGYGAEAVKAVLSYSHEVLSARLCALIHKNNHASRRVAEGIGMTAVSGTGTERFGGHLLYAEHF